MQEKSIFCVLRVCLQVDVFVSMSTIFPYARVNQNNCNQKKKL